MPEFDVLSSRDVADIGLQRTNHLLRLPRPLGSLSYRAWTNGIETPLLIESRLRRRQILKGAWSDAEQEWTPISRFVPDRGRICDIGCGHAFIDLVAANNVRDLEITLIDIERTDERYHEFNSKGAGYSNLAQAKKFLCANGVAPDGVSLCNPERDPLPEGPFDLILSLYSAGFHYPIDEYTDFALRTLRSGGAFIFDLRNDAPQKKALSSFSHTVDLWTYPKSTRVAAFI